MTARFRVEPLGPGHDRAAFRSGVPALDRYLHELAMQDMRRRIASAFVALVDPGAEIAGFYTIAATGLPITDLPEAITRRLPRYPTLPAIRLGRLAVARDWQGHKLGAALLIDALRRCQRSGIAAFAMVVDAKDESAAAFYRHHGFLPLADASLHLFLPIASAERLLGGA